MKKARFIGILMAAVMAAVPFTGTAKNMGINSIEAKAYNHVLRRGGMGDSYGFHIDQANNKGITKNSWIKNDSKIIGLCLRNDDYMCQFIDGILIIFKEIHRDSASGIQTYTLNHKSQVYRFDTGGADTLCFQLDGNLVAYDSKTGRPTAHTGTCSTYQSTNQGYAYEYVLTNDGRLLIYRYHPGYCYDWRGALKGKYQIIWDSSKDRMYRI